MQPLPAPTPEGMMTDLSRDQIEEALSYNRDTGDFTWVKPSGRRAKVGSRAGSLWPSGYIGIGFMGKRILAHRLAWFIHTGGWPVDDVDHINGVKTDNRICNLRAASRSQNMANTRRTARNTSGVKGVHWCSRSQRWIARIMKDGKQIHFGAFKELPDAAEAYATGSEMVFGEYARAA